MVRQELSYLCCSGVLQKEILLSDVVVCSVAYILTFAITASTVFLSLKVNHLMFLSSYVPQKHRRVCL